MIVDPREVRLTQTAVVESSRTPDSFFADLFSYLQLKGGTVVSVDETRLSAVLGSRLALYVFGPIMKKGRERLPILVDIAAHQRVGTAQTYTVRLMSNEGRYLFGRISIMDTAFRLYFDEVMSEIRAIAAKPEIAPGL
ncbi:MAG: hypothetical protein JWM49_2542 [Microbacteriaceae bacterium]|nr:hypothetical protein [Microbacteriaceae bacterium]